MMAPRIAGFICCQSPSFLVTEMKSRAEEHAADIGNAEQALAPAATAPRPPCSACRACLVSSTGLPGRNFRVAGFGVASVWMNIAVSLTRSGSRPCRQGLRRSMAARLSLLQELASISSSLRWPGTIATGIGNVPAVFAILVTSGPGPSLPVPAASTRMPMSASSSISLTISSEVDALADHHVDLDVGGLLGAASAALSSTTFAASIASACMMSATPSHCAFVVAGLHHAQHHDRPIWCGRRASPPR